MTIYNSNKRLGKVEQQWVFLHHLNNDWNLLRILRTLIWVIAIRSSLKKQCLHKQWRTYVTASNFSMILTLSSIKSQLYQIVAQSKHTKYWMKIIHFRQRNRKSNTLQTTLRNLNCLQKSRVSPLKPQQLTFQKLHSNFSSSAAHAGWSSTHSVASTITCRKTHQISHHSNKWSTKVVKIIHSNSTLQALKKQVRQPSHPSSRSWCQWVPCRCRDSQSRRLWLPRKRSKKNKITRSSLSNQSKKLLKIMRTRLMIKLICLLRRHALHTMIRRNCWGRSLIRKRSARTQSSPRWYGSLGRAMTYYVTHCRSQCLNI